MRIQVKTFFFILTLLLISSDLLAIVVPHPKIPLDPKDSIEYNDARKSGDIVKIKHLVTRQALAYYDEFVKQYNQLNNTKGDPLPAEMRGVIMSWIEKQPIATFQKTDSELLELEQSSLIYTLSEAAIKAQGQPQDQVVPEEAPQDSADVKIVNTPTNGKTNNNVLIITGIVLLIAGFIFINRFKKK